MTVDKVAIIRERLKAAHDRHKSWEDLKRRSVEFNVDEKAYVKVSPMKGIVRFSKTGKLNLRYVGPFEVLENSDSQCFPRVTAKEIHPESESCVGNRTTHDRR